MRTVSLVKRPVVVRASDASPGHGIVARISLPAQLDGVAYLVYLVTAIVVVWPLWSDLPGAHLFASEADQTQFEWYLAYAAHALTDPANPLFTTLLNPPDGANLMANASVLGVGLPLTPVTLVFGPTVSLALALTAALSGTASAWYWLLSRRIVPALGGQGDHALAPNDPVVARIAAWMGAAIVGFSPTLVAHAGGAHLNLISQFLLPFILWLAVTLHHAPLRRGLLLGVLIAYQLFIGGETLLMAALAIGVLVAVHCVQQPRSARADMPRYLAGLGTAAGVALLAAGYPLWMQLRGPQSYADLPYNSVFGAQLPALTGYSTESVGGASSLPPGVVLNTAEQNGFFGWPLLVLTIFVAAWLWRRSAHLRAVAILGAVFLLLSMGSEIVWKTGRPGIQGPWRLFEQLPLVDMIPAARLTMVVTLCIAILLACAVYLIRVQRWLLAAALVAALLPIAPTPLTVDERPSLPAFFSDGQWRRYVRPDHTLVAAPRPDHAYGEPMRWQMHAGFQFRLNGGYFMSPQDVQRHGWYTPPPRPSEEVLRRAALAGQEQSISAEDRRAAVDDLHNWRADAVVLDARHPSAEAIRSTIDQLYGVVGQLVGGVWVWDVRNLHR